MSFVINQPSRALTIVSNGCRLAMASFSSLWLPALAVGLLNSWWGVYADFTVQAGGEFSLVLMLLQAISALLAGLLSLIMLRRLDNIARGLLVDLDDEFFAATRAFLSFLLASLIYGLAATVGILVFVAPGIYLIVSLGFYYMFLVLEGAGPLNALGSSFRLVEGQWWHTFSVFLLTLVIIIAVALPLLVLVALLLDDQGGLFTLTSYTTDILMGGALNMLLQPLGLSLSLSLYYELRARKATLSVSEGE